MSLHDPLKQGADPASQDFAGLGPALWASPLEILSRENKCPAKIPLQGLISSLDVLANKESRECSPIRAKHSRDSLFDGKKLRVPGWGGEE